MTGAGQDRDRSTLHIGLPFAEPLNRGVPRPIAVRTVEGSPDTESDHVDGNPGGNLVIGRGGWREESTAFISNPIRSSRMRVELSRVVGLLLHRSGLVMARRCSRENAAAAHPGAFQGVRPIGYPLENFDRCTVCNRDGVIHWAHWSSVPSEKGWGTSLASSSYVQHVNNAQGGLARIQPVVPESVDAGRLLVLDRSRPLADGTSFGSCGPVSESRSSVPSANPWIAVH
jgi:hypothetical protein